MQKKKLTLFSGSLLLIFVMVALLFVSACSSSTSPTPQPAPPKSAAPASSAAQPPAGGGKVYVLNAISSLATNSPSMQVINKIGDLVNQRSNGQLQIKWIGGPEAIAAADQPTALRNGMFDFLVSPTDYYQNLVPVIAAANMCQYTVEEQEKNGINEYWNQLFNKGLNAKFLGWSGYSQYYIFINKEIKNPKTDFQGLKMRSSAVYVPFLKALGAVPVTVATPEVYSALQSGIVDGAGWVPDQVYTFKAYEVLKYWIDAGFYYTCMATMVNLNSFNALPKNLQDILTTSSTEVLNKFVNDIAAAELDYLKQFGDKGMKTITLSPDDKAWFLKLANDAKWADVKTIVSQQDYDKLYKLLTKP